MRNLSERIAALSPQKRELLMQQLSKTRKNVAQTQIRSQSRDAKFFSLSFAQQRLWFLDQLDPGNSSYNIPTAMRIKGRLNVAVLQQSLNEIIRRHEVLRTAFKTVDRQPVQVVMPSLSLTLPVLDLRKLPETEQEPEVQRIAIEEAQRPFDLAQSPLLRVKLLHLSQSEYVILLTMHHIISDGWSMEVLIQEVATLYEAFFTGKPSPLPELSIQYVDFAVWQRQWLQGEVLEAQLSYWKQRLSGELPVLQFPTDRPRPADQSFRGARQSLLFPKVLSEELETFSQEEGVTPFMTLLAAFKTLLRRYTGQEDICVGSPIANRNRAEIEGLIGFFVNTLVLRCDLSGNPSFRELLSRVREVALGAYAHQDLPFEKLVDELHIERNLSRNPLFQVMFALNNAPRQEIRLANLTLSGLSVERRTTHFDLSLEITETESGFLCSLEYSTDLFDAATITRLLGHFQVLLKGIVVNPDQHLSDLPILTEAEWQQLLVDWNDTQADYPQDQCIDQRFEAQVERTPDAIAVVFEDQQLTYRKLNAQANQLAHHLRSLGVGPEVLVGICVERSLEMVVGLLGILKAGGAYVPLDPAYPQERLAFMLEDAQVPVLLTQKQLVTKQQSLGAHIVCLDTDWEAISQEGEENLVNRSTPENLTYAIYTSGSTGKPKGVMIQHRSLVNYTETAIVEYALSRSDRILQFSSLSFDAAAEEIFPCLVRGATLILRTDEMLSSIPTFLKICRNLKLTVLDLPTAFWHQMVAELSATSLVFPESVRLVIIGGERALPERLVTWQQQVEPSVRLVNSYGPTEATIVTTICELSGKAAVETSGRELPIGRAVSNAQTYILDPDLQPTPVGVPGELYIGGVGLARGYLNRPDLTAERFIPNLFNKEPGGRLYKTGDLARYLPDGNIEFLGRIDHQVKIRGFRIELGEIEAVLSQHPAVRETVVLAQENVPGDQRLVAYVVAGQQSAPSISDLRCFLKEKLPEYMLPSVFVQLETLPLTPNGKVDRRALPKPDAARPELDKAFVAPRTPVEAKLAEIWAEVLGVAQVGIHDNFFELGGDSILSLQIIARANQAGLQLTPKQLFRYQNIAELAAVSVATQAIAAEQGLVTGSVPLTPIQQWFFAQNLPDPHHFNQAVLLEVRQALDLSLLEQALQQLLFHHDALRLRFEQTESGLQKSKISSDAEVPLTRFDFSERASALEGAATELQTRLNLSAGSLVQSAFFDFGVRQPSRLLLVIHHLAVDGVSWRILLEDLQTAYQQLSQGRRVQLPAKTTSFKHWSERLREYAHLAPLQQELDYWLSESRKQVSPLPVDYLGGDNTMASAEKVSVALSVEQTQTLLKEVPKAYNTRINEVLLTALVQTFAQWTGEQSLLVDLEGHGREEIFDDVNLSRTVGWFTTLFPVLLDIGETANPGTALKAIKEQLRGVPSGGIGYGVLRYLSDDEEISETLETLPQAEVIFNYLGQFDQTLSESSWFGFAQESIGPTRSLRGKRCHLLEIDGLVNGGQLQLNWTYSKNLYRRATVESLAQSFIERLRSLIAHCQSPEAGGYTPSDFPLAKLDQQRLDELIAQQQQIENIYSLSPLQRGLLFETVSASNSGTYITQLSCILHGNLNVSALKQSWQLLVDRHSVFRTALVWESLEQPLQIVRQRVHLPWQQHDWRALSPVEQQAQLESLLQADRVQGFTLTQAPLMRITLIQLAENTYQFIWSCHHLVLDGWSMALVFKEVFTAYEALRQDQNVPLALNRPYCDYIAWLQQQNLSQAEAFWRQMLKGFTAPTPLGLNQATEKRADAERGYDIQTIKLSPATTAALQSVAQQYQLTLNTIVQGTWALLLNHYSGKKDVVFGATSSGRPTNLAGVESMIGLFINTLPVRVKVSPQEFLLPWLTQIQAQQIEARQYEYSSLAQIQRWSDVSYGVSLFESIVIFENYPIDSSLHKQDNNLSIRNVHSVINNSYPLTLRAVPKTELSLQIMYDCYCFDTATVVQRLEHIETLLSNIAINPNVQLEKLTEIILKTEEQQQLIKEKELEKASSQKFRMTKRRAIRGS